MLPTSEGGVESKQSPFWSLSKTSCLPSMHTDHRCHCSDLSSNAELAWNVSWPTGNYVNLAHLICLGVSVASRYIVNRAHSNVSTLSLSLGMGVLLNPWVKPSPLVGSPCTSCLSGLERWCVLEMKELWNPCWHWSKISVWGTIREFAGHSSKSSWCKRE